MMTGKFSNKAMTMLAAASIAFFAAAKLANADGEKIAGDAAENLPIFDAHIHYKEPAWGPFPPETVIEMMDDAGVAMALVSSTPDAGTIKLWEYAKARIVPELRPYHGSYGSGNWTKSPGMMAYLRHRMERYPHRGIGEFHIHRIDPNDRALLEEVAALAQTHDAVIHVHSGDAPVRLLYEIDPGLTIIWAHAGMTESPGVITEMMDKYASLYADTSYREHEILGEGDRLDPSWKQLLLRHSGRFMVGSDTWVNSQWAIYRELISVNRAWLAQLPMAVAEKIAYRNAEKLFDISVKKDLIGRLN